MITLTEEEKRFIKRAIVSLKTELEQLNLDPTKKEDLLLIINEYRAKGYLTARRMDGGKDSGLWKQLRNKLGSHIKEQKTILEEQLYKNAEGIIARLNEFHNHKIENLKNILESAELKKTKAISNVEQKILDEIEAFDNKKHDALKRLEVVQKAREKIIRTKKHEKHKVVDGMEKCWECGDWFKAGAGITAHKRIKHGG